MLTDQVLPVWEVVVWSGMSGAIALLCLVSAADIFVQKSVDSFRSFAFIAVAAVGAVLHSGVPLVLAPELDARTLLVLRASLGPLAVALALNYLIVWLGVEHDDTVTRWVLSLASGAFVGAAVSLAGVAMLAGDRWRPDQVLLGARVVVAAAVPVLIFVSARAMLFGDRLSRWLVVLCVFLMLMLLGGYAKIHSLPEINMLTWVATAVVSVVFFALLVLLTSRRNREESRIKKLAMGVVGQDFNIPMPQGSELIPKVAEVMWRSHRLERDCVVAAIVVRNLYELGEKLGHGVEAQILAVLAARIRRHVGFRNVVGLYHPRCFVLAVSSGQDPRRGRLLEESLLRALKVPVSVGARDYRFEFSPSVGMGVVDVTRHELLDALPTIDQAEHLALNDLDIDAMLSRPMELVVVPS